jgi:hydrogenase nickel incorporation protein HypB
MIHPDRFTLATLFDRFPALGSLRTHRFGHETGADDTVADVLAAVEREAEAVHGRLAHDNDIFAVEFLGATGSGKTALIERLLDRLPATERAAVVAGDVAGDDDARRYRNHGVRAVDVTTGKDCHLDPGRVDSALDGLPLSSLDTLFVENVGNMVCPADFPLGTQTRVVVVSVTEGDDVVRKHPLLFQACDLAVVNKVDIAEAVDAGIDRMRADITEIAPKIPVVTTSAQTGAGIEELETELLGCCERHERTHGHPQNHADRQGH